MTKSCRICCEIKPRFFKPETPPLIKATQPFERLSVDFKGPLPSPYKNYYMLTITDEYTRFPIAFPCRNMEAKTVINCLKSLFKFFGMPSFVHSDRAKPFTSRELLDYFTRLDISTSYTSVYSPRGNEQCKQYNAIIWTAVKLALKSKNLPIEQWQVMLPEALHSIRSLVCTATNMTPHERMFNYNRRSCLGLSMPTWLCAPGTVLLRSHVKTSKNKPTVNETELLHATPDSARIRLPNGHKTTVSLRDIAPPGTPKELLFNYDLSSDSIDPCPSQKESDNTLVDSSPISSRDIVWPQNDNSNELNNDVSDNTVTNQNSEQSEIRRSSRNRRAPNRLTYYHDKYLRDFCVFVSVLLLA